MNNDILHHALLYVCVSIPVLLHPLNADTIHWYNKVLKSMFYFRSFDVYYHIWLEKSAFTDLQVTKKYSKNKTK